MDSKDPGRIFAFEEEIMRKTVLRRWGAAWFGFSLALGFSMATLPAPRAQEAERVFEGGHYDNSFGDDWFYDSYSYDYDPVYDQGWYDYDVYDGYYDDEMSSNDWYYDSYDDSGDAGLFDI